MAEERSKVGVLIAVVSWLVIAGAVAVAARKWVIPAFRQRTNATLTTRTGSEGMYRKEIKLAADAFSGYAVLRSQDLADRLKERGIRLTVVDDKANYAERIRALRAGETQMAVFTIDSFLKAGSDLGEFPGSIVYVVDETKGADAIVAYTNAFARLADLDTPKARFVCTPDSPSEFLARVVIADFSLPRLSSSWRKDADGAAAVYRQLTEANRDDKNAYVLWEPYVSRARQIPGTCVLVDSSRIRGLIVDVLVVQREFLVQDGVSVRAMVEEYARSVYAFNADPAKRAQLIIDDARLSGETLSRAAAEQLIAGIEWRNTVENYAHFGLTPGAQSRGIANMEDMLVKVARVLTKTAAVKDDPLRAGANTLFYDQILRAMKEERFHPGRASGLPSLSDPAPESAERVRGIEAPAALSDAGWESLLPVGELDVPPITFARGTAEIGANSQRELAELAKTLRSWPLYYIQVIGQARPEGDPEANRLLARERADAVVRILGAEGVEPPRIRTKATVAAQGSGQAQSVTFMICQKPY